ncbi:hypothetical protein AB0H42_15130 [Nocardia sp. NPDC050799]|uniref:hypothetical protein n=1 Tax=Nocardia sp. NPDC050799 TaxID=3154842 RepID=UPI0034001D4F
MTEIPTLPARAPTNRAMAATLRLWRESERYDHATVEEVLEGLRALCSPLTVEQEATAHGEVWHAR